MAPREWTLKRNCSITPRQLAGFYASLCTVSLLLGGFFTLQGAWYVLIFSLLELSAVGAAFLYYARHACYREYFVLDQDCLMVELIESEKSRQFRFDVRLLRVAPPGQQYGLVRLEAAGTRLEVGRFLTQFRRRQFALELQHALRAGH